METNTLTRVFTTGSLQLQDIDPNLPPEDILKLYALNYPQLANATLADPIIKGQELHYAIENAVPVKTKG